MKVLAINCGSSTLKFDVIDTGDEDRPSGREQRLARGIVDRIGGHGAIQFTAENNEPAMRACVCAGMGWCGLTLDKDRNAATVGAEERISADHARVHAYVIPVDEAVIIARDTASCLSQHQR